VGVSNFPLNDGDWLSFLFLGKMVTTVPFIFSSHFTPFVSGPKSEARLVVFGDRVGYLNIWNVAE
jgi:hypothetical protein